MADKQGGSGVKVIATFAAFAAAYSTRKLLTAGWRTVTGKEPPNDPHDPQVGIGEALGWAILIGAGIEAARLLAVRAATRKSRQVAATSDEA